MPTARPRGPPRLPRLGSSGACPLRSPPRARPRLAGGLGGARPFPHGAGAGAGRLRRASRPRRGAASPRPRPRCGRFEAGRGWSLSVCARRGGGAAAGAGRR